MVTALSVGALETGTMTGDFTSNYLFNSFTPTCLVEISADLNSRPTNTPQAPQGVKTIREESTIRTFFWDKKRYILKYPVPYTVEEEDGYFTYECNEFNMLSCAKGREAALAQFNEEFASIYDMFVNEPDANLAQDTLELKKKLRELVRIKRDTK